MAGPMFVTVMCERVGAGCTKVDQGKHLSGSVYINLTMARDDKDDDDSPS